MGMKFRPVSWAQYLGQKLYHLSDGGGVNEKMLPSPSGPMPVWHCTGCATTWKRDLVTSWSPHEFMKRFGIEETQTFEDHEKYVLVEVQTPGAFGSSVHMQLIPAIQLGRNPLPQGWRLVKGICG